MLRPRMTNWNIKASKGYGKCYYVCYRSADPEFPNVIACFDTEVFETKEEAARRCRELNTDLVWSHHADRHPQHY